jgi:hypothetical protein
MNAGAFGGTVAQGVANLRHRPHIYIANLGATYDRRER